MKRFVYFYFNRATPDVARVVPAHVEYWRSADLPDYMGGPFADRSGGLISFKAESLEEAERLARADPFAQGDLLTKGWVKEWMVEE